MIKDFEISFSEYKVYLLTKIPAVRKNNKT